MASEAGPSFELSSFLITFLMTLVPRGALDGARDRPRTRIQFRLVARVSLSSAKKKNVSCPCLGAPPPLRERGPSRPFLPAVRPHR